MVTEFFWKEPDVIIVLCELLGPQSLSFAPQGHYNTKAATEDKLSKQSHQSTDQTVPAGANRG